MRVSTFIILLIVACCGCGLLLFAGMNRIHEEELQAKEALSQSKLAMRDLSILETSFQQWLVLSDLILGSDQTYLQQGATELAAKIGSLKLALDKQLEMLPEASEHLDVFDAFATRQSTRLSNAMSLDGHNREERLYDLLIEMDEDTAKPIEALSLYGIHSTVSFSWRSKLLIRCRRRSLVARINLLSYVLSRDLC